VDPGRTPQPIGAAHLPDQIADLSGDRWTAPSAPGIPSPEGPESLPMPADHRLRSDDRDGLRHAWAEAIEPDKEQPIRVGNRRRRPDTRRRSMFT